MGFTQRQAAGTFTREEAEAFIDQLEDATDGSPPAVPPEAPVRLSSAEADARRPPTDVLAAELQRRGWIVVEP